MIEVDQVSKAYANRRVVDQVSFTVSPGEIFGLLGPNGAGKTTTMGCLTGLLRPDSGRIRVAGYDVVRQRSQMVQRIGVAFELPALYPRLTVEENLRFLGALHGAGVDEVTTVMTRWGLTERRRQSVHALSKGWKQRTMLARAFLGRPRVVFLDEPTSGLDPNAVAEIHQILRSHQSEGMTLVLTTHDMTEAAQLCDRVGIMAQGHLLAIDPPAVLVGRLQDQTVQVTWWNQGTLCTQALPLADPSTPDTLSRLLRDGTVVEIHSTGSLNTVYRRLTGGDNP